MKNVVNVLRDHGDGRALAEATIFANPAGITVVCETCGKGGSSTRVHYRQGTVNSDGAFLIICRRCVGATRHQGDTSMPIEEEIKNPKMPHSRTVKPAPKPGAAKKKAIEPASTTNPDGTVTTFAGNKVIPNARLKAEREAKAKAKAKTEKKAAVKPTDKKATGKLASPAGHKTAKWFKAHVCESLGGHYHDRFAVEVFNETKGLSGAVVCEPILRGSKEWTNAMEEELQAFVATLGTNPDDRYEDYWNPGQPVSEIVRRTGGHSPYPTAIERTYSLDNYPQAAEPAPAEQIEETPEAAAVV